MKQENKEVSNVSEYDYNKLPMNHNPSLPNWMQPKETPSNVSVSVEEVARFYCKSKKRKFEGEFNDGVVEGSEDGFIAGANWQKEQLESIRDKEVCQAHDKGFKAAKEKDKELVRELLKALKEVYAIAPKGIPIFEDTYTKTKLAVEKANNYLNQ
jgi:hypothetical protein